MHNFVFSCNFYCFSGKLLFITISCKPHRVFCLETGNWWPHFFPLHLLQLPGFAILGGACDEPDVCVLRIFFWLKVFVFDHWLNFNFLFQRDNQSKKFLLKMKIQNPLRAKTLHSYVEALEKKSNGNTKSILLGISISVFVLKVLKFPY